MIFVRRHAGQPLASAALPTPNACCRARPQLDHWGPGPHRPQLCPRPGPRAARSRAKAQVSPPVLTRPTPWAIAPGCWPCPASTPRTLPRRTPPTPCCAGRSGQGNFQARLPAGRCRSASFFSRPTAYFQEEQLANQPVGRLKKPTDRTVHGPKDYYNHQPWLCRHIRAPGRLFNPDRPGP